MNENILQELFKEEFMNYRTSVGFLSDEDLKSILDKEIVICDYSESNLTDIGYNLTPTEFIFSINEGLLVPIKDEENKKFCWIEPNDTVLILTREAVWVSEQIAGTFHSKVKIVSQGFGHISTTLDANWEGPLLISLNNPTKKRLKFVLGEYKNDGFKYSSFVTLILYRMSTPTNSGHDNLPCRIDILKNVVVKKHKITNLFSNKYDYLKDILAGIQYESIGIGSKKNNRVKAIEEFKKQYVNFARNLEFLIRQAHSVNRDIISLENKIGDIFRSSIGLLLVVMVVLAWLFRENEVTKFGIIIIPLAISLLPFILKK